MSAIKGQFEYLDASIWQYGSLYEWKEHDDGLYLILFQLKPYLNKNGCSNKQLSQRFQNILIQNWKKYDRFIKLSVFRVVGKVNFLKILDCKLCFVL